MGLMGKKNSKGGVTLSVADLTNSLKDLMILGGKTSGLFQKSLMFRSHSGDMCLFLVNGLSRCWNWI